MRHISTVAERRPYMEPLGNALFVGRPSRPQPASSRLLCESRKSGIKLPHSKNVAAFYFHAQITEAPSQSPLARVRRVLHDRLPPTRLLKAQDARRTESGRA